MNELKKRRRNELEKILSVFDQSAITNLRYILDVDDESFPEKYHEIISRLRKAMEDPKKRREMELEEEILYELQDKERTIAAQSNTIAAQGNTIAAQGNTIATLQSDNQALQSDNQALKKRIAELERSIIK